MLKEFTRKSYDILVEARKNSWITSPWNFRGAEESEGGGG
jgi:hypothetical protein